MIVLISCGFSYITYHLFHCFLCNTRQFSFLPFEKNKLAATDTKLIELLEYYSCSSCCQWIFNQKSHKLGCKAVHSDSRFLKFIKNFTWIHFVPLSEQWPLKYQENLYCTEKHTQKRYFFGRLCLAFLTIQWLSSKIGLEDL